MKNIVITSGLSLLMGLGFVSCNNEPFEYGSELLSKSSSTENVVSKVKFADAQLGVTFSQALITATTTPVSSILSVEEFELPIDLTAPAPENFTIAFAVEGTPEIREQYRKLSGRVSPEDLPEGVITLETPTVAFKAGETTSKVKVKVDRAKLLTTELPAYSVGAVVAKSTSASSVGISEYSKFYINLFTQRTNIKPIEEANMASKVALNLSSGFTFSVTGNQGYAAYFGSASQAYDNDPTTRWHMYANSTPLTLADYFEITFAEQSISGLSIKPFTSGSTTATPIRNCTISARVNGEWKDQGRISFNPLRDVFADLEFYAAIPNCTGIRIHPNTGGTNRNASIGELKLYQ